MFQHSSLFLFRSNVCSDIVEAPKAHGLQSVGLN